MAKEKTTRPQRPDAERRLRQAGRHSRTIRLLQLLLSRGRYGMKDLAAELNCTKRTVYRDLKVLEYAGVPWHHDPEGNCYRVRPGYLFPVMLPTDDELMGQALASAIAKAPGLDVSKGARSVTQRLAAKVGEDQAKLLSDAEQLVGVLNLKLADHRLCGDLIRTIQWSLVHGKQLTGQYASPYQKQLGKGKMILNPVRLCLVQQAWYLVAQPADKAELRTYRVARFQSLRMLETQAKVPVDFDLNEYFGNAWGVYRGSERYDVEVLFNAEAAPLVTETIWHKTQTVKQHKDGSATLSFSVDGLDEILWWILGWSGRAKVLQPGKLRQMVVEQLRAALKLQIE
jgi:predicted DNA-binding transcriptional regulator YafY